MKQKIEIKKMRIEMLESNNVEIKMKKTTEIKRQESMNPVEKTEIKK